MAWAVKITNQRANGFQRQVIVIYVAVLVGIITARNLLPRAYRKYAYPAMILVLLIPLVLGFLGSIRGGITGGGDGTASVGSLDAKQTTANGGGSRSHSNRPTSEGSESGGGSSSGSDAAAE